MTQIQWWTDLSKIDFLKGKAVALTIGNFDGVHLGHRELVERITSKAHQAGGVALVLTFHPHPVQVLHPERKHTRLFDLEDQRDQFAAMGVDVVMVQPFSRDFSELGPEQFLQDYLLKNFHPRFLVVGHDFSFGAHREGQHEFLREFCRKNQIDLEVVPALKVDGKTVSTSAIRAALESGDLNFAKRALGRNYYLKGIVEKGDQRGRLLGFPTANIKPVVDFFPRTGVYACKVKMKQGEFKSVTNIGLNRTFVEGDLHPIKVETHVFDFDKDIYGQEIKIELVSYLREEKKFSGIEELKTQIAKDVIQAKDVLK